VRLHQQPTSTARLCSMGMTKAAVLPDPVRAMPTTSWPCSISGIVRRWMGVGSRYPCRLTPRMTFTSSAIDSASTGLHEWGQCVGSRGGRVPPRVV